MGCHSRKAPPKQALKVASGSVMPCSVPATCTAHSPTEPQHQGKSYSTLMHSAELSQKTSMPSKTPVEYN